MIASIRKTLFYFHLSVLRSHCRYLYSLYFCIKHFGWKIGKRLPLIFCENAYASVVRNGKIILGQSYLERNLHTYIGQDTKDFDYQCERTYINVEGILRLSGVTTIRRGALIDVCGELTIGDDCVIGPRTNIRAHNNIQIGDYVRIAHETQIFDTNFHFSEDVTAPGFYPISKPISIGSYCWIGNRTTINKGTILPDYTTVASNSLVTKDYSSLEPYSLIGGAPAKFIKGNFSRVWDTKREFEYQKKEFSWYRARYEK